MIYFFKFNKVLSIFGILLLINGCLRKPKSSFNVNSTLKSEDDGGSSDGGVTTGDQDGGSTDGDEDGGDDDQDEGIPPVVDKSDLKECSDWNEFLGVDDPFTCYVWHILANGQLVKNLSRENGNMANVVKLNDLNIGKTYSKYQGEGVRIHISDTGFDHDHEDLFEHYDQENSRNYRNSITNPADPIETGSHGTMCGGLAGAVGGNNIGLLGVAWKATMSGDNFLGNQGQGQSM